MTSPTPYLRLPRPTLWLVKGDAVPSFYIGKAPVTNEEYEAFDAAHARGPTSPGDRDPVVDVSFDEATRYCAWYAAASGKAFRLPTDEEWEHACRGDTTTRFPWGDGPGADTQLWDAARSSGRCHEVETSLPNPFGLYDMLGNVWEWTASGAIRGGSFRTPAVEPSTREVPAPNERRDDLGFRIVRSL